MKIVVPTSEICGWSLSDRIHCHGSIICLHCLSRTVIVTVAEISMRFIFSGLSTQLAFRLCIVSLIDPDLQNLSSFRQYCAKELLSSIEEAVTLALTITHHHHSGGVVFKIHREQEHNNIIMQREHDVTEISGLL